MLVSLRLGHFAEVFVAKNLQNRAAPFQRRVKPPEIAKNLAASRKTFLREKKPHQNRAAPRQRRKTPRSRENLDSVFKKLGCATIPLRRENGKVQNKRTDNATLTRARRSSRLSQGERKHVIQYGVQRRSS